MHKESLEFSLWSHRTPGTMVHAYNLNTKKVEVGNQEFKVSLG